LRHIISVLAAAAIMAAMLVASVSPAFAAPGHGYAGEYPHYGGNKECLYGNATHNPNKDGYSYYCRGNP
jgi:hypothetical protein